MKTFDGVEIKKDTLILRYEVSDEINWFLCGRCLTECPVIKETYVGSMACEDKCKHLIKHIEENQIVICDKNHNRFKKVESGE